MTSETSNPGVTGGLPTEPGTVISVLEFMQESPDGPRPVKADPPLRMMRTTGIGVHPQWVDTDEVSWQDDEIVSWRLVLGHYRERPPNPGLVNDPAWPGLFRGARP